jgi:hypothetical protein
LFNNKGETFVYTDSINTYEQQLMIRVPYDFFPEFLLVNENNELPLARTYNLETIKGTGLKVFANALLNLNVQQNSDSATILAEQYWVGASQYEVVPKGIRIHNYRYWNLDGYFDANKLKGQIYLSYDGTTPTNPNAGYLDYTLPFTNEDSLVLLYKAPGTNSWVLHTNNTQLTGGSKTDKTGRFTVNKIEKGMYAIGVYDYKVGLKNAAKKETGFILYPNPTKHQINIEISEKLLNANAIIYDMNGKEIQKVALNKTLQTINIEQLTKGTYFINIENLETSTSKKFIVE